MYYKNVLAIMLMVIIISGCSGDKDGGKKINTAGVGILDSDKEAYKKTVKPGGSEYEEVIIPLPGLSKDAIKLEMVLIKPGSYIMGRKSGKHVSYGNHWPAHKVYITKPFYIGKYEVTQAQWEAIMGRDSHHSKFINNPDNPVEKVSWLYCKMFINRLNKLGLGAFRLPTEAEWEYACRAGTETEFFFGDIKEYTEEGKNFNELADQYMWWKENDNTESTKKVGSKLPNSWGLYDMHGNVSEWCLDVWEKPYKREDSTDPNNYPTGWFTRLLSKIPPGANHVFRGGSIFYDDISKCGATRRDYEQAWDFHYSLGLRLVMEY